MNESDRNELAQHGVATVYEAAGRTGLLDIPLMQLLPGSRVAGAARTVRCGQGDNLMVHAVLDQVQPGEVLVLTMPEPEPVALIGELLARQALVRQVAGILVDAAVRDTEELQTLGLPIWARWIRVRGATKTSVGTINEPVLVGGATIAPGDLVLLDADGAVALPATRASLILEAARERTRHEAALRAQLQAGALTYDLSGLRAVVEEGKRNS
ncbi:MAG TPA: 4-carboxy-4-hydroxy-2-oxoadipate aldolase/oxaloacetate decarboxylase [Ktedonobacterales bacterium]|jgi:4-hydroxy-4-methyl-2-oxoglutarate aldolase